MDTTDRTGGRPEPRDQAARIAELEARLARQEQESERLREQAATLQAVLDAIPYAVYWKDPGLVYRGCNRRFADDLGISGPEALVGKTDSDLPWHPDEVAAFAAVDRRVLESRAAEYDDSETVVHPDGRQEWFETYKVPILGADGAASGIVASYNNITSRKQAQATVEAQAQLLEELSTPIIPLTDRVLVLPMIGALDSRRAQQMLSAALGHLERSRADYVFIDITGVPVVDTQVAMALLQTARAVQLLGARLVLTGIRPEVAQSLVGLGVDLNDTVTYSTLQRALSELLEMRVRGRAR